MGHASHHPEGYGPQTDDERAQAQRAADDEDAALLRRRRGDDDEARRCACCGGPCRPEDAPRCLACTLLAEEETEASEMWNYPEQHHD